MVCMLHRIRYACMPMHRCACPCIDVHAHA
jgi:hypothetical protein